MQTVWTGTLDKMRVAASSAPDGFVQYALVDAWPDTGARSGDLPLNGLVGARVRLEFTGQIHCVACARPISRTFAQGYCFPCSRSLAEADLCMVRPELCHYHDPAHPCRDETFARTQCFQPHYLYCALTSGVKVGITRQRNIPARWIDQGAVAAIPLALLPSRGEVGLLEKRLSDDGFTDRTHWSRMLRGSPPDDFDLAGTAQQVVARLRTWGVEGILPAPERRLHAFRYPVERWPIRVVSLDPARQPQIDGRLEGIKGQYLLFDCGVINLRRYSGYRAALAR